MPSKSTRANTAAKTTQDKLDLVQLVITKSSAELESEIRARVRKLVEEVFEELKRDEEIASKIADDIIEGVADADNVNWKKRESVSDYIDATVLDCSWDKISDKVLDKLRQKLAQDEVLIKLTAAYALKRRYGEEE